MFGYKRSYSSSGRGYNSFGRPYYKYGRRGTVGRAAAGASAAKRSDKTETYSCTVNGVCQFELQSNQHLTNVKCFHPFAGGISADGTVNDQGNLCSGGAVNDRGFRMKCACYDEMKIDSVRVTLNPTQLVANNPSITLCSMWDRKATPKEVGWPGTEAWMANGTVPTATEIYNNEGTVKTIINTNSIYGTRRYCKASSIIEKGGYYDSSIQYNDEQGESTLLKLYLDAWLKGPLAFSPSLCMVVYCPLTFEATSYFSFSYKVEYTFTFRNPKSDLDYFLQVETPGAEGGNRSLRSNPEIQKTMDIIYKLRMSSSKSLEEAHSTLESLFVSSDDKKSKKDEEDVMMVEDDPGTS